MRIVILALTVFFMASCGAPRPYPSRHPQINCFYDINWRNDCEMERKGFYQIIYASYNGPEIEKLDRYFVTRSVKLQSVDEARMLFFSIIETYIEALNKAKELRPYIKNYPLTYKNFHLMIQCSNSKGEHHLTPYISIISNTKNVFSYAQCDENGNEKVLFSEPAETAYATYLAQMRKETKD
jgi:hypothetical protein